MKRPFPLAYKVVLAFLVVLLPILVIFLLSLKSISRNTGALVNENLRSTAEARSGELLFYLESLKQRVLDFSTDGMIRDSFERAVRDGLPEDPALSAYLIEHKLPVLEDAYRLSIMRMDGKVVSSTDRTVIGENRSGQEFFLRGREGPSISVRPSGVPDFVVSVPLHSRENGELIGVLAAFVPKERLGDILARGRGRDIGITRYALEGYRTLDMYIVNRDRLMITPSWLIEDTAFRTTVDSEAVRACLGEGRDHLGTYEDYRGEIVLGTSICMPEFGWVLLTEVDRSEAFAPVRHLVNYGALTGAIVLVLVSGFALYFLRMARQLKSIASASKEIAAGNYSVRVPVRNGDEIGILASHFNKMAGEVEERNRAISESEEKFRGLVEATSDWVWEVDENAAYTYVSPKVRSILGYEPEEIIGRTPFEFMPPGEAERVGREFAAYAGKREPFSLIENTNMRKDGSFVVLETSGSPIFDSNGVFRGYRGVDRDITARKTAEDALRKSESRLANAQRIARLGNWDWDIVKNDLHWSDEIYRIFGVAPREFGATYEAFLNYVHPEDREKVIRAVDEALYRKAPYSIDHRVVLRDGTEKTVHEQGEVVYDDGRPLRMTGTVLDITERKKTEDEIRKLNIELEERVAARTAELEAANRELEAFSYSVAHDLKTPLRTIDGFARILLKDSSEALGPSGREYLERLVAGSRRMGELIDALLKLSRVMRAEMAVERVYLSGMARAVASDLRKAQPERNAEFIIHENLAADGDPGLLKTVMENLIGNAWKFTSKKDVARIEFGSSGEEEGKRVFFVSDNGAGFEMKYAERLFNPFQRLHGEDEFPGTGVGLATVQRIIQRHGGRIWAEGERDKGATFYFTL
ncbi:MAG: PAS domain-containing protein [Deltaproteobacteria bacterium]|nr:PAS domain-containing protein [Deltaproteobacteria bacterium]MBZ0220105.1 PAS domain-containing protein [Deltaproteobacteria bacterium]